MPSEESLFPTIKIELFRRWIREGAKDDSPAGAIETPVSSGPTVYHAPPVITAVAVSRMASGCSIGLSRNPAAGSTMVTSPARLPDSPIASTPFCFRPTAQRLAAVGAARPALAKCRSGTWPRASRGTLFWFRTTPCLAHHFLRTAPYRVRAADKSIRIFDVAAGKEIRKMDHHEDWVFGTNLRRGRKAPGLGEPGQSRQAHRRKQRQFIENVNLINPTKEALAAIVRHPKKDWVLIGGEERVPYLT